MESREQPIGYWLKRLDGLISQAAQRALAEEHLTRRHWQVMNILRQSPQGPEALTDALRPFWEPGAITLDQAISGLADRGWLTRDQAGQHALTPAGQAAHAAVQEKIRGVRAQFLTGLTEHDYHQTVQTLQQMAANLERAAR
jgi:DNA-binding MarR family transcriptional regulator